MKLKILQVALAKQDYALAAHVLVYGMVKAKIQENQKNGSKKEAPQKATKTPASTASTARLLTKPSNSN